MAADTQPTLFDRLLESGLLDTATLDELGKLPEAKDPDPRALGKVLFRNGARYLAVHDRFPRFRPGRVEDKLAADHGAEQGVGVLVAVLRLELEGASVGRPRQRLGLVRRAAATAADADAFEALATTVPLLVEPGTGAVKELGAPGLYQRLSDSPDGEHLLVHRIRRPSADLARVTCGGRPGTPGPPPHLPGAVRRRLDDLGHG